jgi:hypothetical protein
VTRVLEPVLDSTEFTADERALEPERDSTAVTRALRADASEVRVPIEEATLISVACRADI